MIRHIGCANWNDYAAPVLALSFWWICVGAFISAVHLDALGISTQVPHIYPAPHWRPVLPFFYAPAAPGVN